MTGEPRPPWARLCLTTRYGVVSADSVVKVLGVDSSTGGRASDRYDGVQWRIERLEHRRSVPAPRESCEQTDRNKPRITVMAIYKHESHREERHHGSIDSRDKAPD